MTPNKQVSPVIRISRGERDASARATHLEAATRKFLVTTNERKYMSTTTNFKRIALVAVAALGMGVLSSVPAQATVSGLSVTITDGTAPASTVTMLGSDADTRTAAIINIKAVFDTSDSITVQLLETSKPTGATGNIVMYLSDSNTSTNATLVVDTLSVTNSTNALRGIAASTALTQAVAAPAAIKTTKASDNGAAMIRMTPGAASSRLDVNIGAQLDSATSVRLAGTYTYLVVVKAYEAGQTGTEAPKSTTQATLNIVVAALADVSATATATYGFGFISGSTTTIGTGASTTADAVLSKLATAGTTRAYLYVGVRNAANGVATAKESLTATVTGVGLVCLSNGTTCGKSLGPVSVTAGDYEFQLQGDGNGGTSTVTVTGKITSASYAKSLTYYAAAAKTLTASVMTPVLALGSNDSALSVTAVDAAGSTWGGTAYIVASAAADATAVGGSATTPVACVYSSSKALHYCPISAVAAGTGKFKVIDAATVALATATSNEVSVVSKNAIPATVKIAFNKTAYAPGEVGQIIVTPLDAAGAGLPATSITNALASGGITSNLNLTYNGVAIASPTALDSTALATSAYAGTTSVAGAKVFLFTAPTTGGVITLTAKGGTGLPLAGQVALTASATITDNAAAALAAVTALATTVASLKTLITTLTNLVLKIQKKVKA